MAASDSHDTNVLPSDAETLRRIGEQIKADLAARSDPDGAATAVAAAPQASAGSPASASGAADDGAELRAHLARLAHELRTPLAAVVTMADVMRGEHFGPLGADRYREYAVSIHDTARHMLAVVESMLDRNRLEAEPPLTFADLDLAEIVRALLTSMAPVAHAAGIALRSDLAANTPHVVADARAVRQILLNLVGNALKFTRRGGTIEVRTVMTGDGALRLQVTDDGVGMAADEVARAIRRTAPAAGAAPPSSPGAGLGLGLPISHALAAANGGHIEIESDPGRGTSVALVLPSDRLVPV